MTNKIFEEDIAKVVMCAEPRVSTRYADGENVVYFDTEVAEGETVSIEVYKYIPLANQCAMIENIANNVAYIDTKNDEVGEFVYQEYLFDYAVIANIAKYFTDIDETIAPEMLYRFFKATQTGIEISKLLWGGYQVPDAIGSARNVIEYRKSENINTQALAYRKLEREVLDFVKQMTDIADMFVDMNKGYESIDSDQMKEFIDAAVKLSSMEKDQLANNIVMQLYEKEVEDNAE